MTTYLVGYDIHPTNGETYEDLFDAIKSIGKWWHHLDSTWVLVTDKTAVDIRNALWKHMYDDDQLLVVESGSSAAWKGFDEGGSNWLKKNI